MGDFWYIRDKYGTNMQSINPLLRFTSSSDDDSLLFYNMLSQCKLSKDKSVIQFSYVYLVHYISYVMMT